MKIVKAIAIVMVLTLTMGVLKAKENSFSKMIICSVEAEGPFVKKGKWTEGFIKITGPFYTFEDHPYDIGLTFGVNDTNIAARNLDMRIQLTQEQMQPVFKFYQDKLYKWINICVEKDMTVEKTAFEIKGQIDLKGVFRVIRVDGKLVGPIIDLIVGDGTSHCPYTLKLSLTFEQFEKDFILGGFSGYNEYVTDKINKEAAAKKAEEENAKKAALLD